MIYLTVYPFETAFYCFIRQPYPQILVPMECQCRMCPKPYEALIAPSLKHGKMAALSLTVCPGSLPVSHLVHIDLEAVFREAVESEYIRPVQVLWAMVIC